MVSQQENIHQIRFMFDAFRTSVCDMTSTFASSMYDFLSGVAESKKIGFSSSRSKSAKIESAAGALGI
jgi:glycine cleavage system pyridoxal-binding protein P